MAIAEARERRKIIPTLVKDRGLVEAKRLAIVGGAVSLFIRKGYHQTTTRELAREAGISVGSLYEYVASKEDILYLVCESIHGEVEGQLLDRMSRKSTAVETLESAINAYVRVCDRLQDSILLIYRETASLSQESRRYVLDNEERITSIFEGLLEEAAAECSLGLDGAQARRLMAHNIVVLGHMWAYRRWFLHSQFTLDEFIRHQTSLLMGEMGVSVGSADSTGADAEDMAPPLSPRPDQRELF